jgi:hypothetical protein
MGPAHVFGAAAVDGSGPHDTDGAGPAEPARDRAGGAREQMTKALAAEHAGHHSPARGQAPFPGTAPRSKTRNRSQTPPTPSSSSRLAKS